MGWIAPAIALSLAAANGSGTVPAAAPEPLATAPVQTAAIEETVDVLQARPDRDDRLTVPVRIVTVPEGRKEYRFVVDTASQWTVLASETAARLALPAGEQLRVVGIAGSELVGTSAVDTLELGQRSFAQHPVALLEAADIGADGIVGLDSLQGQRVLFDFQRNTIAIGTARELGGNSGYELVVVARRRGGQLIITDAAIDGVRTSVIVDTGSNTSIGNRALQRALNQFAGLGRLALISATGQEVVVDLGAAKGLKIKDTAISNVLIGFSDAPPFALLGLRDRPALLLGMRELRLFGRVAMDFKSRRILFDVPDQLAKIP